MRHCVTQTHTHTEAHTHTHTPHTHIHQLPISKFAAHQRKKIKCMCSYQLVFEGVKESWSRDKGKVWSEVSNRKKEQVP